MIFIIISFPFSVISIFIYRSISNNRPINSYEHIQNDAGVRNIQRSENENFQQLILNDNIRQE